MARWQALVRVSSFADGLSDRYEDVDRRAAISDRRESPAWNRLGGEIPLGRRFQFERLLQTRSGDRRDGGKDSTSRQRSATARHDHLGRMDVVLRRRGTD